MEKDKIALCLAGSGSRGIVQCGAIQAINDLGIQPDHIFTSSSGTLNGIVYAAGDLYRLDNIWRTIKTQDVYKKNLCSMSKIFTDAGSMYDSSPLLKTIKKALDIPKLRSSSIKTHINTTDLTNYKSLTFEISELSDEEIPIFAYASASPPIFFPPVPFRGIQLVDSGVANNYSLVTAINEGCNTIIVISPSISEPKEVNNLADMLKSIMTISMQSYLDREIRAINKVNSIIDQANVSLPDDLDLRKIKLVVISPDKPLNIDFLDFNFKGYDRKELIQYGYNLAIQSLKGIV